MATAAYKIACYGDSCDSKAIKIEQDYACINEKDLFSRSWHAIVLNLEAEQQDRVLTEIRQSKNWLKPVFLVNDSSLAPHLADGLLTTEPSVYLERYYRRQYGLRLDEFSGIAERVAAYAWLRPEFALAPKWQPELPLNYSYPLLEAWQSQTDPYSFEDLSKSGIVEPFKLVDRIRLCSRCESGFLNYVDVCPQCRSIDIQSTPAIHCFTCGHVDEQDVFLTQGRLRCPKCLTTLRHIGVDYDRPLESYHCSDCKSRFVEAVVIAKCHHCSESNAPSALIQRNIYSYRLGAAGKKLAKSGELVTYSPLKWGQPVAMEHFAWLVKWMNELALEHRQQHGIFAIRFSKSASLPQEIGKHRAQTLLDELQRRLLEGLRQADILTRHSDGAFLVLLPNTDNASLKAFGDKIALLQDVSQLEIDMFARQLPDEALAQGVESWLSQWLKEND